MLVIKRFIRNQLAIIGLIITVFMFLFSFVGGLITPYGETEVFKYIGTMSKEYASVTLNEEFRYSVAENMEYNPNMHSNFILSRNKGENTFTYKDENYYISEVGKDFYKVFRLNSVAQITYIRGIMGVTPFADFNIDENLNELIKNALINGSFQFYYQNNFYVLTQNGRDYILGESVNVAFESLLITEPANPNTNLGYEFKYILEDTLRNSNLNTFELEGNRYELNEDDNMAVVYKVTSGGKEEYALISQLAIQPISQDVFLSIQFKEEMERAISDEKDMFIYPDEDGNDVEYTISRLNNVYTIKTETKTHLISMHEKPSYQHWLGTDKHGMDVLTRLMYGGRISLVIGFIVVLLETILGVIMGGIAGYFGKWIDMFIMRIVDVFNCIPFLPLMIIIGSVMDSLEVDPKIRIYYLMLILGIMSWPGIARMVRGQILSLREQEFMLAAEATGLSVSRRIFKHLIPNVIPQLIVLASLGLGGIILYESTLSFLGLGVKFPYASWGNIISGVTTAYEMTNFWFVWIPAGMLILLTVLGFNFVGDGLRDAFDPKMKR
ncbi:MAG: ABC transporter permease [Clostridiales bacterium]|nr:ABC transporter permease [Clostridiales bacterium]